MIDKDSFLVSYRDRRGEPRGPSRKSGQNAGKGDCIDCKACIAVCPASIDIRDGAQLECIQCALCIDACNDIMTRIGRPQNLIGYATIAGLDAEAKGAIAKPRLLRPRTMLYAGLILLVGIVMLMALNARSVLDVSVLPDRNPLYVSLSDGGIRNGYTLKILNKLHEPHKFEIAVDGLPGARLTITGLEGIPSPTVTVPTDVLSEQRIFVAVPAESLKALAPQMQHFSFVVRDIQSGRTVRHDTTFRRP